MRDSLPLRGLVRRQLHRLIRLHLSICWSQFWANVVSFHLSLSVSSKGRTLSSLMRIQWPFVSLRTLISVEQQKQCFHYNNNGDYSNLTSVSTSLKKLMVSSCGFLSGPPMPLKISLSLSSLISGLGQSSKQTVRKIRFGRWAHITIGGGGLQNQWFKLKNTNIFLIGILLCDADVFHVAYQYRLKSSWRDSLSFSF